MELIVLFFPGFAEVCKVNVFVTQYTPIQVYGLLKTIRFKKLNDTFHLSNASAGGHQYQGVVRRRGNKTITERRFYFDFGGVVEYFLDRR